MLFTTFIIAKAFNTLNKVFFFTIYNNKIK